MGNKLKHGPKVIWLAVAILPGGLIAAGVWFTAKKIYSLVKKRKQ